MVPEGAGTRYNYVYSLWDVRLSISQSVLANTTELNKAGSVALKHDYLAKSNQE